MHNDIKELTGRKRNKNSTTGGIKSKDGRMLFETDDILKRWTEYIGELFEDDRPNLPKPSNFSGSKILQVEVESAMKESPKGKSPGEDGINYRDGPAS